MATETASINEDIFRRLVEIVPHGIQECDRAGTITYSNPAHARMLGYADGELVGKPVWELVAPEGQRDELREYLAQLVTEQPQPVPYQATNRTKDGRLIEVAVDWMYNRDAGGAVTGFIAVITDITARVQAERRTKQEREELQKYVEVTSAEITKANRKVRQQVAQLDRVTADLRSRESNFWQLANSVPALFSYIDADGTYRFVNRCYEEWFEISADQIVGKHYREVLGEALAGKIRHRIEAVLSGQRVEFEDQLVHQHLGPRCMNALYVPDEIDGEIRGFYALVTDVTERKNVEQANVRAREESEALVLARTQELTQSNEELRKEIEIHRQTAEALQERESRLHSVLASTLDGVITIDPTGVILLVNPAASRLFGYAEGELIGQKVNQLMPEPYSSEHDDYLRRYLDTGDAKVIGIGREITCLRSDGTEFPAELSVSMSTVGESPIFTGIVRDITERRKAESKLAEQQRELTYIARRSTMGEMAAGLAHEINQPLGAISNFASNCLHLLATADVEELRVDLKEIVRITKRCSDIVNRIRSFVKKKPSSRASIDVGHSIDDVLAFISREARLSSVDVDYQPPPEPVEAYADPIEIEQLLLNLARNAIDAMTTSDLIEKTLSIRIERVGEDKVMIEVRDTGDGIPAAVLENACEPFVTTKKDGLGMGLSICQSIVQVHQGSLEIVSNPGVGTSVRVTLPVGDLHDDGPCFAPDEV